MCEEPAQSSPTTPLLSAARAGPPLGSVASAAVLTTCMVIAVTLSPSLKYEREEGRTVGVGTAMILRAQQGLGSLDILAGPREEGMDPVCAS